MPRPHGAPPTLLLLLLLLLAQAGPLAAQPAVPADRFDDVFRKYSKRYFGPDYDWRVFKAQAMAESNLDPAARSQVGARGLMQLMPSTYREVRSQNPEMQSIDDAEWNIAAGIAYNRNLWRLWARDTVESDRRAFVFGSYNAGRVTIRRAQAAARGDSLDHRLWLNIEQVAPRVRRWRYRETLDYLQRIEANRLGLDEKGRIKPAKRGRP